jgi:uncharacterized protein (TIGR00255 family)
MAARSMTGFARIRKSGDAGEISLTLKSVNHRALDIHTHLPVELEPYDPALRTAIRQRVARGHVDVRVVFQCAHATATAGLNKPLFEAYLAALDQARRDYGVHSPPDLHMALQVPGMLAPRASEDEPVEAAEPLLMQALDEALSALNTFREREGHALTEAMRTVNAGIRQDVAEMNALRGEVLPALRQRMTERLSEMLVDVPLDPQRVAQEATLLADRSEIAEELARLRVHVDELDQLLERSPEIGKKLDFLLQEMNREATTILSKTSGLGEMSLALTNRALDAKSQIEKIREQALNLE